MISLQDIEHARKKISGMIHKTPVMTSSTLSSAAGNEVFLKCEHLQRTGSFKIRGATNKVSEVARSGAEHVVAASSGNHGQAVAYIARQLGLKATIVVPDDAIPCKVEAIQGYGASVLYGGKTSKSRLDKAEKLADEAEAVLIPPYDDPFIMAGQGTTGLEILEQVRETDVVYVPIGGGGMVSGIATAIKETNPKIRVVGVEPELANDTYLSRESGEIVSIEPPATIADGLRALQPGDMTFPVMQKYLDDLVVVSEDEIKKAFRLLLERMKQVVEPSGAVSVAAAMTNKANVYDKKVVSVISGGNVALDRIGELLGK
ncbi:MAG TPA: threonine/serine dehydratase [Bacillales bacterium]|nr:threonine/serine dehydratase [Bacillales bacterium]